jgi:hypothetical protein
MSLKIEHQKGLVETIGLVYSWIQVYFALLVDDDDMARAAVVVSTAAATGTSSTGSYD